MGLSVKNIPRYQHSTPSERVVSWLQLEVQIVALGLTCSWAIVGFGVGLNALVKSNQLKAKVKRLVPAPTVVVIRDNDVFQAGAVITAVSVLIAALSGLFILLHLRDPLSRMALRLQGFLLVFCSIWLFSAQVPFTHFYRTRSAAVSASIDGVSLPESAIETVEHALGLTNRYKDLYFLRLMAILPWFSFLFTSVAAVVLFMAASQTHTLSEEKNKAVHNDNDKGPE